MMIKQIENIYIPNFLTAFIYIYVIYRLGGPYREKL